MLRHFRDDLPAEILRRQVDEQSDICDVTIKVGQWERKYHRCVLMASPFFDCALRADFIEKTTGSIALHCGSPTNIDMSLMSLYGEVPKFNDNNIEEIVDMAEFFIIPNLKQDCFRWIKHKKVTVEKCLYWLQLSSKYGFTGFVRTCHYEYIQSHLVEILQQPLAVSLSFSSVEYILSELLFSYLPMEDKLRFLIRWFLTQPEKRQKQTAQLLKLIRFKDIPEECLNDVTSNTLVESLLRNESDSTDRGVEFVDVLVIKSGYTLYCYDISRDSWFPIQLPKANRIIFSVNIADTSSNGSEVYLTEKSVVYNVNLETQNIKAFDIIIKHDPDVSTPDLYNFTSNVSVVCRSKCVRMAKSQTRNAPCEERNLRGSRPKQVNGFKRPSLSGRRDENVLYKNVTEVYLGKIKGKTIKMRKRFSLVDFEVSSITSNNNSVIAFMPKSSPCIILYDATNYTIDKIPYDKDSNDKVFADQKGFVILNTKRCTCITIQRASGSALSGRYEVKQFQVDDEQYHCRQRYYFHSSRGKIFRFCRESFMPKLYFQSSDLNTLAEAQSPCDVVWQDLSLPEDSTVRENVFESSSTHCLQLQRQYLQCHVDCPHCKAAKQQQQQFSLHSIGFFRNDYDDYEYFSDSDDY